MKYNIILLAVCLMLFLACKNAGKFTQQSVEENTEEMGDLIEDDEPQVDTIIKLSEMEYVTPDGDTIKLEKPFFKSFEGEIEGRKVQAFVNRSMISESCSYDISGCMYMEGDSSYYGMALERAGINKWRTSQDEWVQKHTVYQYEFSFPGTLIVLRNGHKYALKESEVRYEAYDIFNYKMSYCSSDGDISYKPHWEYDFQAVPVQYSEKYASFFKKNPLSQLEALYYSTNYKQWKHNIHLKPLKGVEDDCFTTFEQGYLVPCYLDENIFVLSYFSHVYSGGAHGMPGTTYFNFDVKTGKLLKLKDFLNTDNKDFIAFYITRLTQKYKDEDGNIPFLQEPKTVSEKFYLLPTGVTFTYYPYELMGFAAGEPELFLSWEDLKSYLIKDLFPAN